MADKHSIREIRRRLEALNEEALACFKQLELLQMEFANLILQVRDVATQLQVLEQQPEGDRLGEAVRIRFRLWSDVGSRKAGCAAWLQDVPEWDHLSAGFRRKFLTISDRIGLVNCRNEPKVAESEKDKAFPNRRQANGYEYIRKQTK